MNGMMVLGTKEDSVIFNPNDVLHITGDEDSTVIVFKHKNEGDENHQVEIYVSIDKIVKQFFQIGETKEKKKK